ncbi:phospholipase-like protein [Artemisia annua]|uniref:Phospholipase-like protein n=1 Tax=Artemisia annua TaxID=35608 RepID=A0A2U1KSP0_ARTAN|nr:phospholipase-like protein [Artemisia annua]
MKGKLESKPNRESLFRSTVFGPWLDVPYASNDSLLMHYVLQHQVSVSNMCPDFPIIYHIGDHYLQFGRKEFCLITGFRFGNVVTPKARKDSPFSDRVFPEKKLMVVKGVKGTYLLKLLRGDRWLTLSDYVVRVCLLIACELVFMGREDRNVIPTHIMALVEHFHEWNVFPWGEYMWEKFYTRTVNVVPKHNQLHLNAIESNPYYQPTYNLYGFCWAFKIWILETFPKSSNWWVKNLNVIPRGIAWTKVATFGKSDYSTIFGQRKDEDSVHGDGEEAIHASNDLQSDGVVGGVNEPSNSNLPSNFSMADLFQQINDCKRRLALMENRGSRMMEVVAEVEEIKSKIEKLEGFFNVDAKTEDVVNKSNVEPKHFEQTDDGSYVNTLTSHLPPHQSPRCSKAADQNDPTITVSPDHPDDCELLRELVKHMEIDQEDGKTTVSAAGKDNGPDLIKPVKPMEIDQEDGKVDYNDSQLYNSSMQFLIRSPDAPAFDAYPPVVVAAQSLLNLNKDQTVSNAEEGHFTDQYLNLDNADKNAYEFSLDDIMEGEYIHDKDGNTEVKSEPVEQPSNAPRIPKTRSMTVKAAVLSPMVAEFQEKVVISPKPVPNFHKPVTRSSKTSITSLEHFQEDLSRPNARTTVNVPEHIRMFLKEIKASKYWFPWGRCDIHVDRRFWLALAGLDTFKKGWLTDNHLDLWVDLLWRFRPNEADWAVVSPHFSQALLAGVFPTYYSNGVRYPVPWKDVERVFFLVNEPDKHWILAELHIATGVVTFYDSLGLVKSNRRSWWRAMKKDLPLRLISYLNECGVLKSKGICIDTLCRNEQLEVKDPVQAALAYREPNMKYWNPIISTTYIVLVDTDELEPQHAILQKSTVFTKLVPVPLQYQQFFLLYAVMFDNYFCTHLKTIPHHIPVYKFRSCVLAQLFCFIEIIYYFQGWVNSLMNRSGGDPYSIKRFGCVTPKI